MKVIVGVKVKDASGLQSPEAVTVTAETAASCTELVFHLSPFATFIKFENGMHWINDGNDFFIDHKNLSMPESIVRLTLGEEAQMQLRRGVMDWCFREEVYQCL